jgi:hypothetical protein
MMHKTAQYHLESEINVTPSPVAAAMSLDITCSHALGTLMASQCKKNPGQR